MISPRHPSLITFCLFASAGGGGVKNKKTNKPFSCLPSVLKAVNARPFYTLRYLFVRLNRAAHLCEQAHYIGPAGAARVGRNTFRRGFFVCPKHKTT